MKYIYIYIYIFTYINCECMNYPTISTMRREGLNNIFGLNAVDTSLVNFQVFVSKECKDISLLISEIFLHKCSSLYSHA